MSDAQPVLALVRDLMFVGRINATAAAAGVCVKLIRDPAKLGSESGRKLIVDLNLAGAIEAAGEWKRATGGDVVGFVAHTDAQAIDRARAAGIDRVLARSGFVELLPQLLEQSQL